MNRRLGATVLIGALVAVILVAASSTDELRYYERAPSLRSPPEPSSDVTTTTTTTLPPLSDSGEAQQSTFPEVFTTIVELAVLAGVLALVVIGLRYLWHIRLDLRWRGRRRTPDVALLDDVAEVIARDAEAQQQLLRTGAPRNAIVACWLRLEAAVVEAGASRNPADTSEEFTRRVLAEFAVDPRAIAQLAVLYREARFSAHEMDESARQQAISALQQVHDGLRARAARNAGAGQQPSANER